MFKTKKASIAFIGAGHVAWHLAQLFFKNGVQIESIASRSIEHAESLAQKVNSKAYSIDTILMNSVDFVFLCVPDDVISDLVTKINPGRYCVVHTSGATDINALEKFENRGVFYPFNTFNKKIEISLEDTPILVESPSHAQQLMDLAKNISKLPILYNSEARLRLHIAGTLANNFVNHILATSRKLMNDNGQDFGLLHALIQKTLNNSIFQNTKNAQSGPASRNDLMTIEKHLDFLRKNSDDPEMYRVITNSILKKHGYETLD